MVKYTLNLAMVTAIESRLAYFEFMEGFFMKDKFKKGLAFAVTVPLITMNALSTPTKKTTCSALEEALGDSAPDDGVDPTTDTAGSGYTDPKVNSYTATYGQTLKEVKPPLPLGWKWDDGDDTLVGEPGKDPKTFKVTFSYDPSQYREVHKPINVTVDRADPRNDKDNSGYQSPGTLSATYGQTLSEVHFPDDTHWKWDDSQHDPATEKVGNVKDNSFPAVFTPNDTTHYKPITEPIAIKVDKATAREEDINVPSPDSVTYGTSLGEITLGNGWQWATESDPNSVIPDAGNPKYPASREVDTDNYNWGSVTGYKDGKVTRDITLTVDKADPKDPNTNQGYEELEKSYTATYGQTLHDIELPNSQWTWDTIDGQDGDNQDVGPVGDDKTFHATFKPKDTNNYNPVPAEVTVNVEPATPSSENQDKSGYKEPTPEDLKAIYSQQLGNINMPEGWSWDEGNSTPVGDVTEDGNKHTATFTSPSNPANFKTVQKEFTIQVEPAKPDNYTVPQNLTATYDQTLQNVQLPEGWSWDSPNDPVGNVNNDDGNPHRAKFTPEDSQNYKTIEEDLKVKVSKAAADKDPAYNVPSDLTAIYGQTLGDIKTQFPSGGGWAWDNIPGKQSGDSQSVGEVGSHTYSATFTSPSNPDNYETVTKDVNVVVSPAKAVAPVDPSIPDITYGKKLEDIDITPWKWSNPGETPTVVNSGYEAYYEVSEDDAKRYTWDKLDGYDAKSRKYSKVLNLSVLAADPDKDPQSPDYVEPQNLTATYGDKLSDVKLPKNWAWDNGETPVGNTGTSSFPATFTPDDKVNYNAVYKDLSVNVLPADPQDPDAPEKDYKEPTDLTAVYGQTLSDVSLDKYPGWAWNDSKTPVGDVGTNKFPATFTPSDLDYTAKTVDLPVTVTSAKAQDITEPSPETVVYGTKLKDINIKPWQWSDPSVTPTVENSGYEAYYPADNKNYDWSDIEGYNETSQRIVRKIEVPVQQADPAHADPSYSEPTNITAVYGQKLSDIALPEGWTWNNPGALVGDVGTNEFTATFTPKDSDNYATKTKSIPVQVTPTESLNTDAPHSAGIFDYDEGNSEGKESYIIRTGDLQQYHMILFGLLILMVVSGICILKIFTQNQIKTIDEKNEEE